MSEPSSFSSSSNSFDDEELPPDNYENSKLLELEENVEEIPPALPPKYSSLPSTSYDSAEVESAETQENKIYTIFESPANSPSDFDEQDNVLKVSDDNNNISELTGLSYYYQNIITKQVLKTCL